MSAGRALLLPFGTIVLAAAALFAACSSNEPDVSKTVKDTTPGAPGATATATRPSISSAGFTLFHERMNPKMVAITGRFKREHRMAAKELHFDWVDFDGLLGGRGAKEPYFMPDGVHTDEHAQRLVADAMIPLIARRWGERRGSPPTR